VGLQEPLAYLAFLDPIHTLPFHINSNILMKNLITFSNVFVELMQDIWSHVLFFSMFLKILPKQTIEVEKKECSHLHTCTGVTASKLCRQI
jgi:hypothetical protein